MPEFAWSWGVGQEKSHALFALRTLERPSDGKPKLFTLGPCYSAWLFLTSVYQIKIVFLSSDIANPASRNVLLSEAEGYSWSAWSAVVVPWCDGEIST